MLFELREVGLHRKFESATDPSASQVFGVRKALVVISGPIFAIDEFDYSVHTDHVNPGLFHGELLFGLVEHSH